MSDSDLQFWVHINNAPKLIAAMPVIHSTEYFVEYGIALCTLPERKDYSAYHIEIAEKLLIPFLMRRGRSDRITFVRYKDSGRIQNRHVYIPMYLGSVIIPKRIANLLTPKAEQDALRYQLLKIIL